MVNTVTPRLGLQAVYICVTCDAALQVFELTRKVAECTCARIGLITGSIIPPNLERYDIIIGTPHDLINQLQLKDVKLDHLQTLFFDDGDVTFATSKVHAFVARLNCRIVYLSTMIKENMRTKLQSLAMAPIKTFMMNNSHKTIKHYGHIVSPAQKISTLKGFIEAMHQDQKAVVFCDNKNRADWLKDKMVKMFDVLLHSGYMDLADRESILEDFLSGKGKMLITTDVLSRGVAIPIANIVINFNIPLDKNGGIDSKRYRNRIGRVGTFCHPVLVINYLENNHEVSQLNSEFDVQMI